MCGYTTSLTPHVCSILSLCGPPNPDLSLQAADLLDQGHSWTISCYSKPASWNFHVQRSATHTAFTKPIHVKSNWNQGRGRSLSGCFCSLAVQRVSMACAPKEFHGWLATTDPVLWTSLISKGFKQSRGIFSSVPGSNVSATWEGKTSKGGWARAKQEKDSLTRSITSRGCAGRFCQSGRLGISYVRSSW